MPWQHHFYRLDHFHYLTTRTYRRAQLFDPEPAAGTPLYGVRGLSVGRQQTAAKLQNPPASKIGAPLTYLLLLFHMARKLPSSERQGKR